MNKRKTSSQAKHAPAASRRVVADVEAYIASAPEAARATLRSLRQAIRRAAPEAEETISYGVPTYKLGRPLLGFGVTAKHCALYVMSAKTMQRCAAQLEDYDTAPTAIRFPHDRPLAPALVRRIVAQRLLEQRSP